MNCERIHPLLAGHVDGQLADLERQGVDEHVAKCPDCRALLAEQRAAMATYRQYPVEEPAAADWQTAWDKIEQRLPAKTKRLTLESLSGMDLSSEFPAEDESPAKQREAAKPRPVAPPVVSTPAVAPVAGSVKRPRREISWFTPMPIQRLRHIGWAHLAGPVAAAVIITMVLLSVTPVIHTDQLAATGQVDISYQVTGADDDPMIIMLQTDTGTEVPLIWVAHSPVELPAGKEEVVQ